MTTIKNINETINKTTNGVKFAEHFNSKTSIKNVLKALSCGHEKLITGVVESADNYPSFHLNLGNTVEPDAGFAGVMFAIVDKAFGLTVDESEEKTKAGEPMSLPDRVAYLVKMVKFVAEEEHEYVSTTSGMLTSIANANDVKKFLHALEKDGVNDNNQVSEITKDVLVMTYVMEIIKAGLTFDSSSTAVDSNGNPVETEVISGAAHSTNKLTNDAPEGDDQTTNSDPPQQTPEPDSGDDTGSRNNPTSYDLMVTKIQQSTTNEELLKNIKAVIDELGTTSAADVYDKVGNMLRPYSVNFVNGVIIGMLKTVDHVDDTEYVFARSVLTGMLPDNWKTDIEINLVIDIFSKMYASKEVDSDLEFDTCATVLTTYGVLLYRLLGINGAVGQDIIEGYRTVFNLISVSQNGHTDADAFNAIVGSITKADFMALRSRINKQLECSGRRTRGTFSAWEVASNHHTADNVLETGFATFAKVV